MAGTLCNHSQRSSLLDLHPRREEKIDVASVSTPTLSSLLARGHDSTHSNISNRIEQRQRPEHPTSFSRFSPPREKQEPRPALLPTFLPARQASPQGRKIPLIFHPPSALEESVALAGYVSRFMRPLFAHNGDVSSPAVMVVDASVLFLAFALSTPNPGSTQNLTALTTTHFRSSNLNGLEVGMVAWTHTQPLHRKQKTLFPPLSRLPLHNVS